MATWIDFKELRAKLKIGDVLASYNVKLKVKGDRATAFCPLPGHKGSGDEKRHSPSFSVHLRKGIFQCFSCGGKGNVLDLACLMDGGNPDDPASIRKTAIRLQETLSGHSNMPANAKDSSPSAKSTEREEDAEPTGPLVVNALLDFTLKHLDPKHPYLSSRGFTPETIDHFGVGYCAKGMMAERIAIPLHDAKGKLVGYAGRLVDDTKISDENPKYRFPGTRERSGITYAFHKSEFLYNGHRIAAPVDHLCVVEGFAGTWSLWQANYRNVVALMGASCSDEQGKLIVELVKPDGKVWLMPDGDNAGMQCAKSLFERISPYRFVRWVCLTPDRQPTDFLADELAHLFQT